MSGSGKPDISNQDKIKFNNTLFCKASQDFYTNNKSLPNSLADTVSTKDKESFPSMGPDKYLEEKEELRKLETQELDFSSDSSKPRIRAPLNYEQCLKSLKDGLDDNKIATITLQRVKDYFRVLYNNLVPSI